MSRGIICPICDKYINPEDVCYAGCTPVLRSAVKAIRDRAGDAKLKEELEEMTVRAFKAERLVSIFEDRIIRIDHQLQRALQCLRTEPNEEAAQGF